MQVLSDLFIRLIRMVIPLITFLTIVIGLAEIRYLKRQGQIGGRAVLYFEVVSTLAQVVGLIVMNVIKPGVGSDRSHVTGQTAASANTPLFPWASIWATSS